MGSDVGFDDMETVAREVTGPPLAVASTRYRLQVVGAPRTKLFDLPDAGEVLIGRAPECAIRIEAPELSRKHARLVIGTPGGPEIGIEDLGSANGTRLGDRVVGRGVVAPVSPGEPILVGQLMCVVQMRRPPLSRARRILPHEHFCTRLESECLRAAQRGAVLAVGRVLVPGTDDETVRGALARTLRPEEAAAQYLPGEYEFLFVGTTYDDAHQRAQGLAARIVGADSGWTPKVGLAVFPDDAASPEALIERAGAALRDRAPLRLAPPDLIVQAPEMRRIHQLLEWVAKTDVAVVVEGEAGVGKDAAAETIHRSSPRATRPCRGLNVGVMSETRTEVELFGQGDDPVSSGMAPKVGLLETCDGGTAILEEVAGLSHRLQQKLLQALQTRRVLRVGGRQPRAADVRIVCTSSRSLEGEVAEGRLRSDLYAFLNGVTVVVPPLRDRAVEVPALARLFVQRLCEQVGRKEAPQLTPGAVAALCRYAWPGNIAELKNVLARSILLAVGGEIGPEHLPASLMEEVPGLGPGRFGRPRGGRVAR